MAGESGDEWTFQLTIVRHGETSENRNRIIQGQTDTVLNEEGKEQVRRVSKRLRDQCFTIVFSSDLQRAFETAEGICTRNTFCKDIKICKEPLLRERNYGTAECRPCAELKKYYHQGKIPDGAETIEQLDKRARIFFKGIVDELDQLQKPHCSENQSTIQKKVPAHVLLVSHGGWIRSLIKYFAKDFPSQFPIEQNKLARQISPNTGVSSFTLSLHGKKVKSVECTQFYDQSHLH